MFNSSRNIFRIISRPSSMYSQGGYSRGDSNTQNPDGAGLSQVSVHPGLSSNRTSSRNYNQERTQIIQGQSTSSRPLSVSSVTSNIYSEPTYYNTSSSSPQSITEEDSIYLEPLHYNSTSNPARNTLSTIIEWDLIENWFQINPDWASNCNNNVSKKVLTYLFPNKFWPFIANCRRWNSK